MINRGLARKSPILWLPLEMSHLCLRLLGELTHSFVDLDNASSALANAIAGLHLAPDGGDIYPILDQIVSKDSVVRP